MAKKFQIFVSSTYKDLFEARKKVMETVLSMGYFPVGMESFSAGDEEQWEIIESELSTTDYYILILGKRYGSLSPKNIGYTEQEYDFAKSLGIPILSFVRDEKIPYSDDERESDPKLIKKLAAFRKKVMANKMVKEWKDINELTTMVSVALSKQIKRKEGIGWVRGDQAILPNTVNELARLSKENSELREQIISLQSNDRKPNFEMVISGKNLEQKNIRRRELDKLLLVPMDKEHYIQNEFSTEANSPYIPISDEFKENFLSKVDRFNEKVLDDNVKIVVSELSRTLENLEKVHIPLKIELKNTGNKSGQNIGCILSFPKDLMILDSRGYNTLLREMEKTLNKLIPLKPKITHMGVIRKIESESPIVLGKNIYLKENNGEAMFIRDKNLHINIDKLLHLRSVNLNDYFIVVPRMKGNFMIDVNIISEELSEPILCQIPLIVEEFLNFPFEK